MAKQRIVISMNDEMLSAVKRQMKRQNKTMSAIVREALSAWLERYGDVVDPSITWGGYREHGKFDTQDLPSVDDEGQWLAEQTA